MSENAIIAIIQYALKFGLDAAILMLQAVNQPNATIDDAIAALQKAATKTADDYLAEAAAATPPATPPPGGWPTVEPPAESVAGQILPGNP